MKSIISLFLIFCRQCKVVITQTAHLLGLCSFGFTAATFYDLNHADALAAALQLGFLGIAVRFGVESWCMWSGERDTQGLWHATALMLILNLSASGSAGAALLFVGFGLGCVGLLLGLNRYWRSPASLPRFLQLA